MKSRLTVASWALAAAAALSVSAHGPAGAEVITHDLLLTHVIVVDTRDGALRRDMNVAVDGGRIASIAKAGRSPSHAARRVVDARGEYLVPGFLDMHAHILDSEDPVGSLELMLANGVTGFRQMSGSPELLARRRRGTLMPTPDAPRLLAMPGTILNRFNAGTPEAATALVRDERAQGADFIKSVDGPPPAYLAGLAEARRQGLTFVGHLPPAVDVRVASKAGMRSIEHLGPRDSIFLGCSTDEAALRESLPKGGPFRPPGPPPAPAILAALITRTLVNPILTTNPEDFPRYERVLDTLDPAKCDELASEFRANQTWQVPTLIRLRTMELADDPVYRNDPNLQYATAKSRRLWAEVTDQFIAKTGAQRPALRSLFAAQLALVRRFDRDHVPLLAGSDFGGGWVIAGFGLHQEFDLLAQAGMSPLEVLQATTLSGAAFMGAADRLGGVEVGKDADLVLLAGDPTRSVANLHKVEAVVRDGRYYSRQDLDAILKRTRDRYADPGGVHGTGGRP